jgi:outer membrane protein OmpA-like peptidoglycan-associated protein
MKKLTIYLLLLFVGVVSAQTVSGEYSIKNIDQNTKNSDFGATFYGDKMIVFASPKKGVSIVNEVWEENGQRFLELFSASITDNGEIYNVQSLKGDVNTKYHEADATFSKNGKTVYFTRNNYYNKKLAKDKNQWNNLAMFKATVNENGEWVNIIPMPFNNVSYSVGHPALSSDERTLYFISDMPGSLGKTDIYKVSIEEGGYGEPVNLGDKINSSAKEFSPCIDGDVIYFSSDRSGGLGKLDVYASKTDGSVFEPTLLSEPINSNADDFAFVINPNNRTGFFSSNRSGGKGDDDIYSFIETKPVEFKCSQKITGTVRDKNTNEILNDASIVLKDAEGNILENTTVNQDGTFELNIQCETSYILVGEKSGYNPQSKSFTSSNEAGKITSLTVLLGTGEIVENELKPEGLPEDLPEEIVKVRPSTYVVNIEPIYFELNSSFLTKEAKQELDKVVDLMERYPNMIIESGSHTDSRGIEGYNIWLSDRRAKSTVSYIVNKGIDPTRITGKGYGESQLINQCSDGVKCSEAEHAKNRRTEFVIIKM